MRRYVQIRKIKPDLYHLYQNALNVLLKIFSEVLITFCWSKIMLKLRLNNVKVSDVFLTKLLLSGILHIQRNAMEKKYQEKPGSCQDGGYLCNHTQQLG